MKILAVIPAKSKSSRLPGKNMRQIGGKSLIEWTVDYVKTSKLVDDIVISTDSEDIRQYVLTNNLCDCLIRAENLAGEAEVHKVYHDAWQKKEKNYDYIIGLQPDHPDRNLDLDEVITFVVENDLDSFFTVDRLGSKNGSVRMFRSNLESISNPAVGTLQDDCTNVHYEKDLRKAASRILIESNPLKLEKNQVFVIAEAGCNHMCSIELATAMIDSAVDAGADAIKFQTYKAENLVTNYAPAYWGSETMSQQEYYRRLDKFGKEEYEYLFHYAQDKGIMSFSTPFGIEDATLLNDIGMEIFKIPSFEIVNLDLIKEIASFGKPMILSTGAAEESEIDRAIDVVLSSGNGLLALMACTISYPTANENANLSRISTLKKKYPNFLIGISDHTYPDENMAIPTISVSLGARIIEKHFTMSKAMTGSGHFFSLEPNDLSKMVKNIRLFENVLGDGILGTSEWEIKAKEGGRKSIVASKAISKGEVISRSMLAYKRPGTGISPDRVEEILGARAIVNLKADYQLNIMDLDLGDA